MAYKVFTSYAGLDRTKPIIKFKQRFLEMLRTKLGTRKRGRNQKSYFLDFEGIRPGDEWNAVLAQAVQEAGMLVCLVSPTIFRRAASTY
jgi:hypothetical protein